MKRADDLLVVEVRDNGVGGAVARGGGLRGLADRVDVLGGPIDRGQPGRARDDVDRGAAVRVVIGEDEVLLRAGLTHVLATGGFDVVAAAGDASGLVEAIDRERPDLVVTDIRMPPTHTDEGLAVAAHVRRTLPGTAVVVLSQHVQRRYALELIGTDPARTGYLLKQRVSDIASFCDDLRRVCAGGTVLDPEVVALMLARVRHEDDAIGKLTPRQEEVLALMAQGRTNAFVARALAITEKTVVGHASSIYELLGLAPDDGDHRRVLAVLRYLAR